MLVFFDFSIHKSFLKIKLFLTILTSFLNPVLPAQFLVQITDVLRVCLYHSVAHNVFLQYISYSSATDRMWFHSSVSWSMPARHSLAKVRLDCLWALIQISLTCFLSSSSCFCVSPLIFLPNHVSTLSYGFSFSGLIWMSDISMRMSAAAHPATPPTVNWLKKSLIFIVSASLIEDARVILTGTYHVLIGLPVVCGLD